MRKKNTAGKTAGRKRGKLLGKRTARKKFRRGRRIAGPAANVEVTPLRSRWLGPRTGGQSGDIQGLPALEESGPESVIELAEEGQDYEAELIGGLESVPDADQGEVRSRGNRESPLAAEFEESE
jgi:hypothetical protein